MAETAVYFHNHMSTALNNNRTLKFNLFIIVINLIFMILLWCIDWVGGLYASQIFMYFCIKSSIGTQSEVG